MPDFVAPSPQDAVDFVAPKPSDAISFTPPKPEDAVGDTPRPGDRVFTAPDGSEVPVSPKAKSWLDWFSGMGAAYRGMAQTEEAMRKEPWPKLFGSPTAEEMTGGAPPTDFEKTVAGIGQAAADTANSLISKEGVSAMIGLGPVAGAATEIGLVGTAAKVATVGSGTGFGLEVASTIPAQYRAITKAADEGDVEGVAHGIGGLAASAGMIGAIGAHEVNLLSKTRVPLPGMPEQQIVDQSVNKPESISPVPEPLSQTEAQLRATADPDSTKAATLVTTGSPTPETPPDFVSVPVDQGTVIVNPEKADPQEVAASLNNGGGGKALGYVNDAKPVDDWGRPLPLILQTFDTSGTPVLEEVVHPDQVEDAAAAHADAVPGGQSVLKHAEEVIAERQAATKPEFIGMGGAATGEPNSTPLSALNGALDAIEPQQPDSIAGRLRLSERIADSFSNGKTAVSAAFNRMAAAGKAIWNWYTTEPAVTDWDRALGENMLARSVSGLDVQRFVRKAEEQVPDPIRRAAIVNYIQADGDTAVLADRAAATKDAALRAGYEAATTLTPEEKTLASQISELYTDKLSEGIRAGVLKSAVENYFTQIWKRSTPFTDRILGDITIGKLAPNLKFAKKRIFDSYFEGEQAGLVPAKKDFAAVLGHYIEAFNQAIADRKFIKDLQDIKTSDGRPAVVIEGARSTVEADAGQKGVILIRPKAKPFIPTEDPEYPVNLNDYKTVSHPALRGWKWAAKDESGKPVLYQGEMLLHPDISGKVHNLLARSLFRRNAFLSGMLDAQSFLKSGKMSLSAFHQVQEGVHGIFHGQNPLNPEPIDFNVPEQANLVRGGLQVVDPHGAQLFSEGLSSTGGLVGKIPVVGGMQRAYTDYLFKDYIPRLKMATAQAILERNRARYTDLTDEQQYRLAARQANAAFGEQNYRALGRNPSVQDFMRLTLLAPDFLEARARVVVQALKPYGGEQRMMLLGQAAALYIGARLLNTALSGNPHWDDPFAVHYGGYVYRFRSLVGDVAHLVQNPRNFFYNRLSPSARAVIEASSGVNQWGVRRSSLDQLKDFAQWIQPISITPEKGGSMEKAALGSVGIQAVKEGGGKASKPPKH